MQLKLTLFDCVSVLTLIYFSGSLLQDWNDFHCSDPIELFMFGSGLALLGFIVCVIVLRNSANNLFTGLFVLAVMFFGLLPFMIVWTVIGTIWYYRIGDPDCIPEEIRKSGILSMMLFANYLVSSLGGMFYCAGLYVCCRLRSQGLLFLSELRQHNLELSTSAYQPLEASHLEQLSTCEATRLETMGETCTICYENFDDTASRPLKLPSCNHLFHEGCIKDWFKLRSTCPYCRSDLRTILSH